MATAAALPPPLAGRTARPRIGEAGAAPWLLHCLMAPTLPKGIPPPFLPARGKVTAPFWLTAGFAVGGRRLCAAVDGASEGGMGVVELLKASSLIFCGPCTSITCEKVSTS